MTVQPVSPRMKQLFLVAVVLMFLHKVECGLAAEWRVSPFFQWLIGVFERSGDSTADALGAGMFLSFVTWLFLGLGMSLLVLRGGWGPHLALAIWGLSFVLEWHHVLRAVSGGGYYPGVLTAVPYLAFGLPYWRELGGHVVRAPVVHPT